MSLRTARQMTEKLLKTGLVNLERFALLEDQTRAYNLNIQ